MGSCTSNSAVHPGDGTFMDQLWTALYPQTYEKTLFAKEGIVYNPEDVQQIEFRGLLNFRAAYEYFLNFIRKHEDVSASLDMESCLVAWRLMKQFDELKGSSDRREYGLHICLTYLSGLLEESELENIRSAFEQEPIPDTVFHHALRFIFKELYQSVYTAFIETEQYLWVRTRLRKKIRGVRMADFDIYRVLGRGAFGIVCHVNKKSTGVHYAMKIQFKGQLIKSHRSHPERILQERQCLATCDHPFIVELYYAFQTTTMVALVMSLGSGRSLAHVLYKLGGPLSLNHVRFYAAEIVSALSYLHDKGLMYRDVKPSNVMLNYDGHIQLVDFGTICDYRGTSLTQATLPVPSSPPFADSLLDVFGSGKAGGFNSSVDEMYYDTVTHEGGDIEPSYTDDETFMPTINTFAGTKGFMSPEIAELEVHWAWSSGYTKAVDWWSLGVTVFVLLTNIEPFRIEDVPPLLDEIGKRSKHYKALLEPVNYNLLAEYPEDVTNFIRALLVVNENARLGYGETGSNDVRKHAFFQNIDWNELDTKCGAPPPKPIHIRKTLKPKKPMGIAQLLRNEEKSEWLIPPVAGNVMEPVNSTDDASQHTLEDNNNSTNPVWSTDDQKHFVRWGYSSTKAILEEINITTA